MTDKPILFSAPMVRALLEGRKTQTRRILNPQPHSDFIAAEFGVDGFKFRPASLFATETHGMLKKLHRPGDRLWVREAWAPLDALTHGDPGAKALSDRGFYSADNGTVDGEISRWRPSIHMPRWASRLTLTVKDVRVERLQDISEADALAEGIDWQNKPLRPKAFAHAHDAVWHASPTSAYAALWTSINGPGSWEANPWVVAYSFTVQHGNIDQVQP